MHVRAIEFKYFRFAHIIYQGLDNSSNRIVDKTVSYKRMKVDTLTCLKLFVLVMKQAADA
jgi:hypothetical protein